MYIYVLVESEIILNLSKLANLIDYNAIYPHRIIITKHTKCVIDGKLIDINFSKQYVISNCNTSTEIFNWILNNLENDFICIAFSQTIDNIFIMNFIKNINNIIYNQIRS